MISFVLKELLKHIFPPFAYWLFYSEAATVVLISALMFDTLQYEPLSNTLMGLTGAVSYFGFCIVGAASYRRGRREARGKVWAPSWFERIVAALMCLGFIALAISLADLARFAWSEMDGGLFTEDGVGLMLVSALVLALPVIAVWSLYRLVRGRWVLLP